MKKTIFIIIGFFLLGSSTVESGSRKKLIPQECYSEFEDKVYSKIKKSNFSKKELMKWWWVPRKILSSNSFSCMDYAKKAGHRNLEELFRLEDACSEVKRAAKDLKPFFKCADTHNL